MAGEPASAETRQEAYSYAQLQVMFGVKARTLRDWRAKGLLIPAFTSGRRVTRLRIHPTLSTHENGASSAEADAA